MSGSDGRNLKPRGASWHVENSSQDQSCAAKRPRPIITLILGVALQSWWNRRQDARSWAHCCSNLVEGHHVQAEEPNLVIGGLLSIISPVSDTVR